MMPIEEATKNGVSVSGIISDYHVHKYDKNSIYVFVNGRWIKNHSLAKALIKGYAGGLPGDKFPAAVLMLTIDPKTIDINVHPRKQEVQFLHPRHVETIITQAVQETLQKHVQQTVSGVHTYTASPRPDMSYAYQKQPYTYANAQTPYAAPRVDTRIDEYQLYGASPQKPLHASSFSPVTMNIEYAAAEKRSDPITQNDNQSAIHTEAAQAAAIGQEQPLIKTQLFKTYIIIESDAQCIMVDQHAAHERILYKK